MTVVAVSTGSKVLVTCVWFDERDKSHRAELPLGSLKEYYPPHNP